MPSEQQLLVFLGVLTPDHSLTGLRSWTPSTEPEDKGSLVMPTDHPAGRTLPFSWVR